MSRIPTSATINDAPEASRPVLEAVQKQIGSVPNIFRLVSNNPAAQNGLTALQGALGKGKLAPATRERIALTMAEANGCDYCLSAHTYTGAKFAKLDESEIEANRRGTSNDPKAAAAVEDRSGGDPHPPERRTPCNPRAAHPAAGAARAAPRRPAAT